jgi:hypothetical protein
MVSDNVDEKKHIEINQLEIEIKESLKSKFKEDKALDELYSRARPNYLDSQWNYISKTIEPDMVDTSSDSEEGKDIEFEDENFSMEGEGAGTIRKFKS